jgi:parallel beta-helix repeat protein
VILAFAAMVALPADALARVHLVRNGDSIQDAVDAARPGDTIVVLPGVYTGTPGDESVVDVRKSRITILGGPLAVIDATGFEYGIMVGEDEPITSAGCPRITVRGFRLFGLTIRDPDDTGVRLSGVDGFTLAGTRYLNHRVPEGEYGPFPVCSRNGLITRNFASGWNDAAIYVGDDVNVDVTHNIAVDSVVGAEIENSVGSEVIGNILAGNAGGLLVFVGANLPMPFTRKVLVAHNLIAHNNRENTGRGAVAGVPEGTGLLVIGADDVTVRENSMVRNNSFGFASIGNASAFLDDRIEPFTDNLRVVRNVILGNGTDPDPLRLFTPPADIIFLPDVFNPATGELLLEDPEPFDNCFAENRFETDFPAGIVGSFPCP